MWLAFYNKQAVGDVLMLTSGTISDDHVVTESKQNITLINDRTNDQTVAVNIFKISESFEISDNGPVLLTEEQVTKVNELIKAAGFNLAIEVDNTPKLVVGYVEECKAHEDSDHLSITNCMWCA